MSITITITDPTKDEAKRMALYFADLAGISAVEPHEFRKMVTSVAGEELIAVDTAQVFASGAGAAASVASALGVLNDTPAQVFASGVASVPPPSEPIGAALPGVAAISDLDSAGLPWDARIHSSSKARVADGTWRLRRGVDDATVASVTAELRGAPAPAPVAVIAPPPPPAPTLQAQPWPIPATDQPLTFPLLLQRITAAKIAPEQVLQAVQAQGLPSLPMLATRPDLLQAVATALGV